MSATVQRPTHCGAVEKNAVKQRIAAKVERFGETAAPITNARPRT